MEQVPYKEEDRESKMNHFVSCVGPDSIIISSSSSCPFLSLLRPPTYGACHLPDAMAHADFWGKSIPDKARAKALMRACLLLENSGEADTAGAERIRERVNGGTER